MDAGHGDKYRNHPFWEKLTELLADEDGSMRAGLETIDSEQEARNWIDLSPDQMDSASVKAGGEYGFPWKNCGVML